MSGFSFSRISPASPCRGINQWLIWIEAATASVLIVARGKSHTTRLSCEREHE